MKATLKKFYLLIIYSSGWLQLDYDYLIQGHHEFMGINFDYPEEKVNGVKWLGNGPYRVLEKSLERC
ncbi:MAG: hypothetical protein ACOCXH_05520 [Cyclobacteriaceae bacterium]